jgi:hypothetical protein
VVRCWVFFGHQIKFVPCEKHFKKDIGKCIGAICGAMLGLYHERQKSIERKHFIDVAIGIWSKCYSDSQDKEQ